MSSKEYPELCSTNKTFVYRNQKFRSYGIGIIKLTGPTGKEPNPCDHISEDEKIRRVEIYEFKTMSIFFEFWKSYNRRNKRNMNHLCDPNLHGIQKFEIEDYKYKNQYQISPANMKPEAVRKVCYQQAGRFGEHCNQELNVENVHGLTLIQALTAVLLFFGIPNGISNFLMTRLNRSEQWEPNEFWLSILFWRRHHRNRNK
ncbi:unnamed protein product [Caenorhabditis nigoni]